MKHSIRSAFEEQPSENAPSSIWSAIEGELEQSTVDSTVKDSFERQQAQAPEFVWERVQDQLDIDRVWTNISNVISVKQYRSVLRYACVFMLLLLPFALDYDSSQLESGEIHFSSNLSSLDQSNVKTDRSNQETLKDVTPAKSVLLSSVSNTINSNANLNNIVSNPESTVEISTLPKPEEKVTNRNEYQSVGNLDLRLIEETRPSLDIVAQSFAISPPRLPIGLTVGGVSSIDNTWIIDNETRVGFDRESLVDNEFSLASSYGVFAEYQLSRRYALTAEYLFQSRSKQHAHVYDTKGNYVHKEREINSYKIALMATRQSRMKYGFVPHNNVLRFGGYLSGVKSDFTQIEGVITNVISVYKRHDLGLRLELGKRVHLNSFTLEGGLKGEFGLANLASFKSEIPPQLNFTRLVSGGAYLRVGYTF